MHPVRRALISVYDKRGLADLARGLAARGVEILSTGGTLKFLEENGIPVRSVSSVTGFPEILEGRVKTLHPGIHGGILADRAKEAHLTQLEEHGIEPIDLVVVNLYPFRETAARPGITFPEVIEQIDVGGPTMVRAAAKNLQSVGVVVDPADYPLVLEALAANDGALPEALRRRLAGEAFRHTASYDEAIANWLASQSEEVPNVRFPTHLNVTLGRVMVPRYGENPHQPAAVYRDLASGGVLGGFRQLQGKELSFNNLLDADAARRAVAAFAEPAVVIVKHNNPCGVGRGASLAEAYQRALATDPVSAFGGILALNRPADAGFVEVLGELFAEVILAPGFDPEARERLAAKKNLRLLDCPAYRAGHDLELRAVDGGFLAQVPDVAEDHPGAWTCPTRRSPSPDERRALDFAWRVSRAVKSNAIVIASGDQTVGIGAGQMSRVDSCHLAVRKAGLAQLPLAGTAAASDAFFPFRDGLDVLAEAGVTAIVHPGGSKRDGEVIAAADERGIAMLLTGTRHFRH